jgi:RNA polymerase sigma-70 factor (ECF subfamily)
VSSKTQQGPGATDDNRLIADCLRGRTAAFGELVRRYQERLYNAVYRLVDNAEDAQDVVQEAFLNAYQSLDSFKGDALFFTWLYRIAFNAAVSLKRKQKAILRLERGHGGGFSHEPLDQCEHTQPGFGLERVEEEQRLMKALHRLSAEHRAVLVLKDLEGLKYEVMAEILAVPIGTIRSRLHRARLELRQILEPDEK